MLGKLILLLLQIAVAWLVAPVLYRALPGTGFELLVYAVLFAIIVFLTGVLGAQVLQGVGGPSSATMSAALILALIVAAVLTFIPGLVPNIPNVSFTNLGLVLAGAIIGYWIKR